MARKKPIHAMEEVLLSVGAGCKPGHTDWNYLLEIWVTMQKSTAFLTSTPEAPGLPETRSHQERVSGADHYRRAQDGTLMLVRPQEAPGHLSAPGPQPVEPRKTSEAIWMGREAMELAIQGHNVIHAIHRKGIGWIDFIQPPGLEKRPSMEPWM